MNNWGKPYNKLAGFQRNEQMAEYADALIAVDGGNGTSHMIKSMKNQEKPVFLYKAMAGSFSTSTLSTTE